MKVLRNVDTALTKAEGALLIACLTVMVAMAFLQVVLRNVFSGGIFWADILLRHLVLWIGFLGAALATSGERHISIDALTRFLRPRIKAWVNAFTNLSASVLCLLLLDAAVRFVLAEREAGTTVYAEIPAWYAQVIIPAGFALIAFHFAVRSVIDAAAALRRGEPS